MRENGSTTGEPSRPSPSLTRREPAAPGGLVLMLHGGKADGIGAVSETSASWRRSRWMMDHVSEELTEAGIGVWLLRYGLRGWNARSSGGPSPVPDARWALEQVRAEHGDLPVVLLGHSMGGRTAVAVADDPNVVGVVGLAPWLPGDEPNHALAGKQLAVAHGRSDKITSLRQTRAFCRGAEGVAASVELTDMGRVGHYMFRHVSDWNAYAVTHTLAQLGVRSTV